MGTDDAVCCVCMSASPASLLCHCSPVRTPAHPVHPQHPVHCVLSTADTQWSLISKYVKYDLWTAGIPKEEQERWDPKFDKIVFPRVGVANRLHFWKVKVKNPGEEFWMIQMGKKHLIWLLKIPESKFWVLLNFTFGHWIESWLIQALTNFLTLLLWKP